MSKITSEKYSTTEQHIKNTAKKLFFVEGHLNATTQEIADAANVNRTLLNYYFRSRDALFQQVFIEAKQERFENLIIAFRSEIPFKEKVKRIIDVISDNLNKYPYAEVFLISELNKKDFYIDPNERKPLQPYLEGFIKEIDIEIKKGNIRCNDSRTFLLTIFSMLSYPVIMKNLYVNLYRLNKKDFAEIFKRRKDDIMNLLFND